MKPRDCNHKLEKKLKNIENNIGNGVIQISPRGKENKRVNESSLK